MAEETTNELGSRQRNASWVWAAIGSVGGGLVVGAVAYAATGTLKVMLSPKLEVTSPLGFAVGLILVFVEGLLLEPISQCWGRRMAG